MAITLEQVNRTETSVTFSISGITNDRQTYIWIPMLSQTNKWITLSDAYSLGYVSSYYAETSYNGEMTVRFYTRDANEYKVWQFYVYNFRDGSPTASSNMLNTILKFEYANSTTKYSGKNIDITVSDLRKINSFGGFIDGWINGGDGYYYSLDDEIPGDKIFWYYLHLPASNIWSTAVNLTSSTLPNRTSILNWTGNIVDFVSSNSTFYASYFNNIKSAINNFNMRC